MIGKDRFVLRPMQKYSKTATNCPIQICCSRQCTEQLSGVNFVQIRMRNVSGRFVSNVFLTIEGLDAQGECLYKIRNIAVAECNAPDGATFGEDRLIAIDAIAASLKITVEHIIFNDRMLWRRQTLFRPREESAVAEDEPAQEPEKAAEVTEQVSEVAVPQTLEQAPAEQPEQAPKTEPLYAQPKAEQLVLPELPTEAWFSTPALADPLMNIQPLMPVMKPAPIVRQPLPRLYRTDKKRRSAGKILIWLLIIAGLAVTAAAMYILYENGNFSIFS